MPSLKLPPLLVGGLVFLLFVGRAHAFGAGNIAGISKVEGENCTSTHAETDRSLHHRKRI